MGWLNGWILNTWREEKAMWNPPAMDKINFMLIMHFAVYATLEVIIIGTVNHATCQHKPHSLRITSTVTLFLTATQTYN